MSRRREIGKRLEALSDIAGIMSAMKGIALTELRALGELLPNQQNMVAGIERAAADFLVSHPEFTALPKTEREFCILLGSEQGFCGDFNETLLTAARRLCAEQQQPLHVLVVGHRLARRLGAQTRVENELPGAAVADEVARVLLGLTRVLGEMMSRDSANGIGLSVLYHCDMTCDIRLRHLLPPRDFPSIPSPPYPTELNIPPGDFWQGLTGHYLHAVLNEVLYSSLMAENRQRQAHMERALQRLDEESERLRLRYNVRRQEEITEEIEVILLSAELQATTSL